MYQIASACASFDDCLAVMDACIQTDAKEQVMIMMQAEWVKSARKIFLYIADQVRHLLMGKL